MAASAPDSATTAPTSPLAEVVDRIGDRWSLLLVEALLTGPRRFADLQAAVPGIAPNILSGRLKQLERGGLVAASAYSKRPPRFVYELTAAGRALTDALRLLASWGASHADAAAPIRHAACGTTAQARWYCPTCARMIDDEATELTYV